MSHFMDTANPIIAPEKLTKHSMVQMRLIYINKAELFRQLFLKKIKILS